MGSRSPFGITIVHCRTSRVVRAPLDEVWSLLDPERVPEWDGGVSVIHPLQGGGPRAGARYRVQLVPGFGWSAEHEEELVEWVPTVRRTVRGRQGSVVFEVTMALRPIDAARTLCTEMSTVELRGPMRLLRPVVRRVCRRNQQVALGSLATHLETRGEGATSAAGA